MHLYRLGRIAAASRVALTILVVGIARSQTPAAHTTATPRPLTDQYCVMCHNQKAMPGGVSLEGIDFSNPAANAAVMEKVLRKLRTGEMPPAGLPRPTEAATAAFTKSLQDSLDKAAAAHPE